MKTESLSLCPECFRRIKLEYRKSGNKVIQHKSCPEHGVFENIIWNGAPDFTEWTRMPELSPPAAVMTEPSEGCPFDCGICPGHRQQACCVVIEVTDRCNQNCPICYASSGENRTTMTLNGGELNEKEPDINKLIEDLVFLRKAGERRPFNLQFSGGEPTVRDDLPELINAAADMGFPYLQLNTNGRRLAEESGYAAKLKDAGLSSVFLQFDGLTDDVYLKLRGEALLEIKKKAINNCSEAGLPVVLVVTLVSGINDDQLGVLVDFVIKNLPFVRGLHIQPVSLFGRFPKGNKIERLTLPQVLSALEEQTSEAIPASTLSPLATGHPLCSFHGRYYVGFSGRVIPLNQSDGGCCCSPANKEEPIIRARDFLAENWTLPEENSSPSSSGEWDLSELDNYISRIRNYGFSITGMLFQDSESVDLERLSACRVHVLSPGQKLIPFCSYNLTSRNGRSIHR